MEKNFCSPFVVAAREGNVEAVTKLYEQISKLASKNEDFYFALYFAAFGGYEKVVTFLLSKKVDPNLVVGTYLTPLHAAVLKGHGNIVKILLDHGANVNPKIKKKSGKKTVETDYFVSPLLGAAHKNFSNIAELLLRRGANVNVKFHSQKENDKLKDTFEKQLIYGTFDNYSLSKKPGFSPLHFAADHNNEALARLLLEHGANINAKSEKNLTPLSVACRGTTTPLVEFLLKEGADMKGDVEKGKPLLYYILHKNFESTMGEEYDFYDKSEEIERNKLFRLMLKAGADPNGWSADGKESVLHYAASYGMVNAVYLLLKHGANVNVVDGKKKTPLQRAVNHLKDTLKEIQEDFCYDGDSSSDDEYQFQNTNFESSGEEERETEELEARREARSQSRQRQRENKKKYNLTHARYAYNIHQYKHNLEHGDNGFTVFNDPDPFRAISQLLTRELVRLEATGEKNIKENVAVLETPFVKPYYTRCKNELKKLKKAQIVDGVNHYDFLVAKDSKLKEYQKNKKIMEALEDEKLEKLAPNYSVFLKINKRKGLKRKRANGEESDGDSDDEEVKKSVQKKGSASKRHRDREQQLEQLQSPFNWGLSKLDFTRITWALNQKENYIPEITFTRLLLSSYVEIRDVH